MEYTYVVCTNLNLYKLVYYNVCIFHFTSEMEYKYIYIRSGIIDVALAPKQFFNGVLYRTYYKIVGINYTP